MPRNLSESIRKADEERPQRELEEQKRMEKEERDRVRRVEAERNQEEQSKRKEESRLRGLFDKHLLPIFKEVAAAKKVSLRVEEPLTESTHNTNPHFEIGIKTEYRRPKEMVGRLTWDYELEDRVIDKGIFRRKETWSHVESYRYLAMGITLNGDVSGPFKTINLNEEDGEDQLWNAVENFMLDKGGQKYQYYPETPSDPGPP